MTNYPTTFLGWVIIDATEQENATYVKYMPTFNGKTYAGLTHHIV